MRVQFGVAIVILVIAILAWYLPKYIYKLNYQNYILKQVFDVCYDFYAPRDISETLLTISNTKFGENIRVCDAWAKANLGKQE